MQKNRIAGGTGSGTTSGQMSKSKNAGRSRTEISLNRPPSFSGALTRARSHSASSKSSNTGTGTTSSGSSSSASSSSSSSSGSGSDSDSSSSNTAASRASSQSPGSRGSRSSRKSQTSDNKFTPASRTIPKHSKVCSTKSQKSSSSTNVIPPSSPQVPTQSHKKIKTISGGVSGSSGSLISSGTISNSTITTQLINRGRNRPPLSGSVTNVKTPVARVPPYPAKSDFESVCQRIPSKEGFLATKKSPYNEPASIPTRPFRRNFAATSSESESGSAIATPIKRVGSKPPSIPLTLNKKPSATRLPQASTSPSSSVVKKAVRNKSSVSVGPSSSSSRKGSVMTNGKLNSIPARSQKKLLKSIFSPDNSSAESDEEKRQRVGNHASSSGVRSPSTVSITGSIIAAKRNSIASRFKKRMSPVPNNHGVTSSSLSGTSSGSGSSSSSSSDSSSESEKKPETMSIAGGKREPSPKSPSGSGRKRPVTRRQIRSNMVKSKTIPTTTMFSESVISPSPLQISAWDSDFSDEPRSLARVPAKCSLKSRPRPTDDEEEMMMELERRCRFPGCDSSGHLSGKYGTHSLLSTCPKYAGFSVEECKENATERQKRETERMKYFTLSQLHPKKAPKLTQEGRNWLGKMRDMKETDTKDGLCSEYDLSLWNDSLALAAARIEIEQTKAISYRSVAVGRYEMACWCESPYSEPLSHSRRLFICEFCLKPVQSGTVLRRHCAKCVWRHPPGDEIYRKDRLSVWEVDGKTQKTYCQNLCLLAKCFLDHKTLYLDVDPFLFYVMTLADSQGCHLVGYFSKEKNSFLNYNVSCILTLPPYQRQGFGRLLIDFSYLLTKVEGKVGSPEKPLSDLGLISYRSYWKDAVLKRMCACATREMNVKDLSIELGVTSADLISTLQFLGMLKYWKGKHLVLKKTDVLEEYLERSRRRGVETRQIEPSCLRWRPFQTPAETSS